MPWTRDDLDDLDDFHPAKLRFAFLKWGASKWGMASELSNMVLA